MAYESAMKINLDTDKDDVLVENNAQTIFDHIEELEKDRKNHEKRWFWELLQNAKDSVGNNETVSVEVSLESNNLKFCHTGDPFQKKDILHLIFHGSSKIEEDGKTGRFGTGFMTTHLLSKKVRIKGQVQDLGYFDFILDRNASDYKQQKKSLDESYQRFVDSINPENPFSNEFKTEFIYELNDNGVEIAQKGLSLLPTMLPIVLAFNSKMSSIVTDSIKIQKIKVEEIALADKTLKKHIVKTGENKFLHIVTYDTIDFNLAVVLEKGANGWHISNISENYPKLFFDFPLFGTEKIGLPFILNSLKFDPKRERDGIYLGDIENEKVIQNREVIELAFKNYPSIIEYFGNEGYGNIHHLFSFQLPSEYTWLDENWFLRLLKSIISDLHDINCLSIANQEYQNTLSLSSCKIPYTNDDRKLEQFSNIVCELFPRFTVDVNLLKDWIKVVTGFSNITEQPIESYDFILTKKKIAKLIDSAGNVEKFAENYFNNNLSTAINWIGSFIESLTDNDLQKYSTNYQIIPNQINAFVQKLPDTPKIDNQLDEDLKIVAENYDWNIRKELVHNSISVPPKNFEFLSSEKILDRLDQINRKITPEEIDSKIKKGFVKHLKWLINQKEETRIRNIKVLLNKDEESEKNIYTRQLFTDESKKLLSPPTFWVEKFSFYKELVRQKFVLSEDYSEEIKENEIKFISDLGIIYSQPLIIRKKKASKNDLKLLLENYEDDIPALCNDKGELNHYEIEFSDIPYLTRSEDNILVKTEGSFKSAKALLKFILFQVLNEDSFFDTSEKLENIKFSKCIWVARLRETQWVPVKPSLEEENVNTISERPSTSNIAELIQDDDEILEQLHNEKSATFLNKLGISISDIIWNSIPDAKEKLQWDLTFSKLLASKKIDPSLAQEMLEDDSLQEHYLKKKKEKELINRNQNIGNLFEQAFQRIFESDEMKNSSLSIERTAFGSDYEILIGSDITAANQEVIFKIGSVLIELKATGKSVAELTPLQAETATKNINRFVLAVLPLDNFDINENNVTHHTRFVTNIGSVLKPHYDSYLAYNNEKTNAIKDREKARLSIEDGQVRYQVKSELWEESSLDFNEFIDWLKQENTNK